MNTNSDFATVVSICPFPINEFKPGLVPATYHIPIAKDGECEVLNLSNKIFYRQRVPVIGNILEIPVPAIQVAESIVNDRLTGQLAIKENSRPGLFWVPGNYTKEEALTYLAPQIDDCVTMQKSWFMDLVMMADDDWNKSHQHRFISDMQRYAARNLGLDRPWLIGTVDVIASGKSCLACYSQMHINASICPICRTDQDEFAARKTAKTSLPAAPPPETVKGATKV